MNINKITKSKHFMRGKSHRLWGMQAPDLEPEIDRLEKIMRHPSFLGPKTVAALGNIASDDSGATSDEAAVIDLREDLSNQEFECVEADLVMSAVGTVSRQQHLPQSAE